METECACDAAERACLIKGIAGHGYMFMTKSGFLMCLILESIVIFDSRYKKAESS